MRKARKKGADPTLKFTRVNLFFSLGGLAAIVAGYYLLGQGSTMLAPVLLVIGYVVLLPLAIIA